MAVRLLNKAGRTVRLSTKFTRQRRKGRVFSLREDLFSKLPEDILISILSRLDLKEATRTSVLSRRWRNLWKYTTRLYFDDSEFKLKKRPSHPYSAAKVKRSQFIKWVNNILKSHEATRIKDFALSFDDDEEGSSRTYVDRWLNFALHNRVQKLQLDFQRQTYVLTTQFLHNHKLDSLTVLDLKRVQFSGESVEHILSHCPFLQALSVESSNSLVHLKVYGSLLKLKHLKILSCGSLKCIEISAVSLLVFHYHGPWPSSFVIDVPNLVEASVGDICSIYFLKNICQFSSCLSRLHTFGLDYYMLPEILRVTSKLPKLSNLKHLDLAIYPDDASSLLCCTEFLTASPLLHRLTLKILELDCISIKGEMKRREAKPHHCLKEVELGGFALVEIYVGLAMHFLERAVSLEKLVIDAALDNGSIATARDELEPHLPTGVELVVRSNDLLGFAFGRVI